MEKKKEVVNVRLEPQVKQALEKLSKEDGRSLSNYMWKVLKDHVNGELKEKGSPV